MFTVVFHRHFSCRQIRDTAELTKVKCVSGVHSLEAASVAIWQPVYNNNSKKKQKKKNYLTLGNTPNQTAMTVTACLTEAHSQTHTLLSHTETEGQKHS